MLPSPCDLTSSINSVNSTLRSDGVDTAVCRVAIQTRCGGIFVRHTIVSCPRPGRRTLLSIDVQTTHQYPHPSPLATEGVIKVFGSFHKIQRSHFKDLF